MRSFALVLIMLISAGVFAENHVPELCRDPKFIDFYVRYSGPSSVILTPGAQKRKFAPYMPDAILCLKRWAEADDGGISDGMPAWEPWMPKAWTADDVHLRYRCVAMSFIGYILEDEPSETFKIGSWILSSIDQWPQNLQLNAMIVLGRVHHKDALPFLRTEARGAPGRRKEMAWRAIGILTPENAATELESLAKSHDDLIIFGEVLMATGHPNSIPAMRRLETLVPEMAQNLEWSIELIQEEQQEKKH